jgi:hypothetical protein
VKRKRDIPAEQGSLFDAQPLALPERARTSTDRPPTNRAWKMPAASGKTVAEIRLRWTKRLSPAQVARVEAELSRLPASLTKLGFGAVQVERAFVRRRKA